MEKFSKLFPKDLYHSYIIEGEYANLHPYLLDYLLKEKIIENKKTDVYVKDCDSFTISDIEEVREWNKNKGISSGKKICILGAKFINNEAEKSLLKILEEPGTNTHFFIIIPNPYYLEDTILSRVHIVRTSNEKIVSKEVSNFIKMNLKERFDFIAGLVKENKDVTGSGKLRYESINLINGIEIFFHKKLKENIKNENVKDILIEIEKGRGYLMTSGSSPKMILEHLAMILE